MKLKYVMIALVLIGGTCAALLVFNRPETSAEVTDKQKAWSMQTEQGKAEPLPQTEEEWKEVLTPEQYRVLRKKGTERAFTGKHWNEKAAGMFRCAGCGQPLFHSDSKFESGTGWPSFWQPAKEGAVAEEEDRSWFMRRTEVHCSRCGGHLGHVFNDGPQPTGLRYCINSAALHFHKDAATDEKTPTSE